MHSSATAMSAAANVSAAAGETTVPRMPRDGARDEVAEALHGREQAERRSAQAGRGERGDGGVLGRLDAADRDPGGDEADGEDRRARAGAAPGPRVRARNPQ